MANDGTGTGWSETSPANAEQSNLGAQEIRDLRKGFRIRMDKEHANAGASSAGGEHEAGSAKAYTNIAASPPTLRPDGVTSLGVGDAGRLWINNGGTRTAELLWWNASSWNGLILYDPANLASNIVTTAKILDANVTTAKIADSNVTGVKHAAGLRNAAGTYTGNGSASGPTVTLGWQPSQVLLIDDGTASMMYWCFGTTAYQVGSPINGVGSAISMTSTGFQITSANAKVNTNGTVYRYIAFG